MVERGQRAVVVAVVQPVADRRARPAARRRRRARAPPASPRRAATGRARAQRDQRDREHERREPHVGIGRAEHDPRQQHEHREQEQRRQRQVARIFDASVAHALAAGSRTARVTEAMSNAIQRSRSTIVIQLTLAVPVEPVRGLPGDMIARAPEHHQQPSAAPAAGSRARRGSSFPANAARSSRPSLQQVVLADHLGGEGEHAQHAPAEGVADPQQARDSGTKTIARSRSRPSRASRSHSANRLSASAIASAKFTKPNWNGIAVGERQREQRGRGDAAMHLARDPQQPGDGQRRDRDDDQLDRAAPARTAARAARSAGRCRDCRSATSGNHTSRRSQGLCADRQLDAVAAHMPGQVDQRRDVGPQQRDRRGERHQRDERRASATSAAFPPCIIVALAGGGGRRQGSMRRVASDFCDRPSHRRVAGAAVAAERHPARPR